MSMSEVLAVRAVAMLIESYSEAYGKTNKQTVIVLELIFVRYPDLRTVVNLDSIGSLN